MSDADMTFGEHLRAAYTAKGMTRADFARAVGVKYHTVYRWERGDFRPRQVQEIAGVLGLPISHFAGLVHSRSTESAHPEVPADLPSRRYRLLVRQLAAELQHKYGYKSEIARQLGIHPSYVKRIEEREQPIGLHTVERAMGALGLSREFFSNEELGDEPNYHGFREASGEPQFGMRLLRLYTARGFNRRSFADSTSIAYNTIQRYESGETTPDLPKLRVLARVLGVTVGQLVGEESVVYDSGSDAERNAAVLRSIRDDFNASPSSRMDAIRMLREVTA